jgi:hypothetical protein
MEVQHHSALILPFLEGMVVVGIQMEILLQEQVGHLYVALVVKTAALERSLEMEQLVALEGVIQVTILWVEMEA